VAQQHLASIAAVAATQHGVFSFTQAADAGLSRRQVSRSVERGLLEQVHPQVYRFVGAPVTPAGVAVAGVLQVGRGAVASHEASLVLHGVDRIPVVPVVTVPFGRSGTSSGVRVHRCRFLPTNHIVDQGAIAATTVERCIVDVASVFSQARLAWLLDHVTITLRLVSVGGVARTLRQVEHRGRRGIGRLHQLLDDRAPGEPTPRSQLETSVDALLARSDVPRPCHEHPLPSLVPSAGLVDRAWPEAQLILEVDGRRWHARERDMARDRARDREAARHGWVTIRVLDDEVRDVPELVLEDVVVTYCSRRAQLGA
jgi:hypothetical protein